VGTADNKPGIAFWVIATVLLLWGLAGLSIYVALYFETPEEFAAGAETAAHAQVYADYVANIPAWAIAVGVIAAVTRLGGAVGLLLRRAWALRLYSLALIFFLAAMFRAFILANAATAMSPRHIVIEIVFVALSIFAVMYAKQMKCQGILT